MFRKFWVFRNAGNFAITVFGISAVGLYGLSLSNESKFNSPVVLESIRTLSSNERAKQTLGFPISYRGNLSNTVSIKEDEQYFAFEVGGKFGKAKVELTAVCLPVSKILDNQEQTKKVNQIQEQCFKKQKDLDDLAKVIKKQRNKDKKAELRIKHQHLQDQVNKLKFKIKSIHEELSEKREKYYIPEPEIYRQILKQKTEIQDPLPPNTKLYKISNLAIQMPNKNRISIIPPELEQNKKVEKKQGPIYATEIRQKLVQHVDDLSEQELAEYSRAKMNFMYQKYSSYRFFAMIVLGISASFAFTYFSKNRIKSVVGSVLVHEAEAYFLRHPKIISLMREQKVSKDHVKWSKSIGGGRRQDSFECMADVNGIPKGKVTFSGSQSNEGRISYSDFSFEYLGKDKSLTKIDLLN